jgi:diaminopimelate epimerase
MKLRFTKMHGTGNDFIVLDAIHQDLTKMTQQQWQMLADRHFGIGADQILLIEKARTGADFAYRIFNADGNEIEQCGNGSRCFARYVYEHGLTDKKTMRVEVGKGMITLAICANNEVRVDMGPPCFDADALPFWANGLPSRQESAETLYQLHLNGQARWFGVLSMGNPHAVQLVEDIQLAPVSEEGPLLLQHACFPQQVNAGYMQVVDRQHILLRVFERGARETLACGTGACAAVVSGIRRGLLDTTVSVQTRGGRLQITWEGGSVFMQGPAETVFTGEIEL